jgi:predicted nucleotidyltransferase
MPSLNANLSGMNKVVEEKLPDLIHICQRHGIRRLELFGSAARDDFQPATSDLDFVVSFDDSALPDGFESYLETLRELEVLFGRSVDLLEAEAITNPFLLEEIDKDRIVLCERANGIVVAKQAATYLHEAGMAFGGYWVIHQRQKS